MNVFRYVVFLIMLLVGCIILDIDTGSQFGMGLFLILVPFLHYISETSDNSKK